RRTIEQKREARNQALARARIERTYRVEVEAAAVALVRDRRVGEPIADDDGPGGERGGDHLGHVLGPIGTVEEELRRRRERCGVRSEKQLADRRAGRGATRLARLDDRVSRRTEVRGERARVRRLSGAFDALERDEQRHG